MLWWASLIGAVSALPSPFLPEPARTLGMWSLAVVSALFLSYNVVYALVRVGWYEAARGVLFTSWVLYLGGHLGIYEPGLGTAQLDVLFVGIANSLVAMYLMGFLALGSTHTIRWITLLLAVYAIGAGVAASRFTDLVSLRLWLTTTTLSELLLGCAAWFAVQFARDLERQARQADELRAQLSRALEESRESNSAKSSFLAHMSHELRTPLTGIVGYVELLLEGAVDPNELARDLGHIRAAANHLNGIIAEVLDLSKIEAGKLRLNLQPVSVRMVLDEVSATARPLATQHGNELHTTFSGRLEAVIADPGRLRQVLLNLSSNAAKFTRDGHITIEAQQRAGGVVFSVTDSGMGIPPDKLESVFQPFEQLDAATTHKYGGTGLGLAISRRLVRMMGGELGVTSAVDVGTTFSFELPGTDTAWPRQVAPRVTPDRVPEPV